MKPLLAPYTQGPERAEERLNVAESYRITSFLGQVIIPQESDKTPVEMEGGVNVRYDMRVSFHKPLVPHLGNKVYGKVRVIPQGLTYNPVFLLEPFEEPCASKGTQKAYHGGDDPALLDEIYLLLKDSRRIAIETNDEPS